MVYGRSLKRHSRQDVFFIVVVNSPRNKKEQQPDGTSIEMENFHLLKALQAMRDARSTHGRRELRAKEEKKKGHQLQLNPIRSSISYFTSAKSGSRGQTGRTRGEGKDSTSRRKKNV